MNTKPITALAQRFIFVLMFLLGGLGFTQANGKNPAQAAGEPAAEFESFLPAEESALAVCTPDTDGMRAYWPFDDGPAATTFDDVIENPAFNDGACVGDACPTSTTSGKVSNAFVFDGVNDAVQVSNTSGLDFTISGNISVETWVKTSQDCSGRAVFVGRYEFMSSAWWLGCIEGNVAAFSIRDSYSNLSILKSTSVINDGEWHHIVGTRDGTANVNKIYVDGVLENSENPVFTGSLTFSSKAVTVGYYEPLPFYWYAGTLDEVAIYDQALSADDVSRHFQGGDGQSYCEDDVAGITVTPTSDLVTSEDGDTDTFTIVLDTQPSADVTIGLSSSDTTEGTLSKSSLTFNPTNWDSTQTVTVTGVDDDAVDGDIPYTIISESATSSDPNYSGLNAPDISVTNEDNDVAGIMITPTSGLVSGEDGNSDTFKVVLTSQPSANVTIGLSSSDLTEGTLSKSSLTFSPTNWDSKRTVRIWGVDDDVVDGDILFTIITAPATSSDPSYSGLDAPDISVTNEDNDVAGIAVTPTSGLVTNEYGGTDTFTVVLTSKPSAEVTFGLSSSDTTEGTLSKSSLTFSPTNWDNPQEVEITGIDDSEDDGDIPYTIITAPATSSDPDYEGVNANDALVINIDDDGVGILVTPFSGLLTTEDGVTDSFSVVLNSQPSANVTIGLSSSDTTEGTLSKSSLTFTAANWNISQTVTIICVDDEEVDGDITYAIITAPASSTDSNYDGLDAVDISVTNLDDDQLVFRIFLPLLNDD
jgi:hypothetical protein